MGAGSCDGVKQTECNVFFEYCGSTRNNPSMTTCIDDHDMNTGTTNMPSLVPDNGQFYGMWYLPIPRVATFPRISSPEEVN